MRYLMAQQDFGIYAICHVKSAKIAFTTWQDTQGMIDVLNKIQELVNLLNLQDRSGKNVPVSCIDVTFTCLLL
jgi:hypothetical protein